MTIKRNKISITVIFAVVSALLTIVGFLTYQLDMSDNIRDQAYERLVESAESQKTSLNTQIGGQFAILDSFAAVISTYRDININQITLQMDAIVDASNFAYVAFITPDGTSYVSSGVTIVVRDRQYFKQSIQSRQSIEFVTDSRVSGGSQIVLSVPIVRDDKTIGVVAGSYNEDYLRLLIDMNIYNGDGYSYIIRADGTVVVSLTGNRYSMKQYENIYDFYRESNFADGMNADDIAELINNGRSGTIEYTHNGNKRYSTYMPVGISDWYILNVVPAEAVEEILNGYTIGTFLLTGLVILLASSIIFVFGMEEKREKRLLAEEKERLFRSDELYSRVQEMSDSLLFECRPRSHEMRVTSDYKSTLGDIIGEKGETTMEELEKRVFSEDIQVWRDMIAAYDEGTENCDIELRLFINRAAETGNPAHNRRTADYEPVWFRMRYHVLNGSEGEPYRVIGKFNNIDAQKRSMALLAFRAERDSLTGLYNHKAFIDHVDEAILGKTNMHGALLLTDIDYFKRINDTYGHNSGDEALTGFTSVVAKLFRTSDIIGRLGGDEVAIFMRDTADINKIAEKAAEINRYISSVRIEGAEDNFAISVSIGIALCPDDGGSFDKLYLNADSALYEAKRRGRKQYVFYGDVKKDGGKVKT